MATYAFSLHAGPYTVWEADADGIPMRLMARQSLAEFVAVEEWFDITRRGLSYYDDYFDIPYPFGKYDQLIVPDFNIGAMENIAAVTFGEFYVQRQASDRTQRESRAGTILHEMAHMWFGDLVTHDWWNGMWLNESFATQMAALAQLETSEFTDTWHGFFTADKQAAYRADSRVTTHPVEGPVNSTIDFFEVFDAITYQKGASTLKQLAHYVGEENYRRGVSSYLKAHAYGNTELDDFVFFQSQASGKDIAAWANEWLYQPGFNTLAAQSECADGELTGLRITQTAPYAYPTLRHHQVDLALYSMNQAGALEAATVLPVTVAGPETVVELPAVGLPCPALMNPNHNDWTLAQIKLDDRDLETLETHLADVPEPLARSMFLAALYQRAMEGRTPLASYLERASALAEHEDNVRIQQQISASLIATVELMQRLRPETDAALSTWLPILEEQSLRQAATAPASDFKRIGFNTFLGVVATEAGMVTVRELLDGTRTIPGLPVTSDLRWLLLIKLAGNGQLDTDALLAAEAAVDDSDYGVKSHLTALAARPDLAQKRRWLAELQNPEGLTGLSRQRAVMGGLFPASQTLLQEEVLDEVLQALPVLSHKVDPYFMTSYVKQLLQPMCLPHSVARMQAALDETADQLDSTALRFLREAHQADSECLILRDEQIQ
jgi:aminopeptidase N